MLGFFNLILSYVSIIPDCYHSVKNFISNRPSHYADPDVFRHDFHD